VTADDVERIKEFHSAGYGRKKIADYIGLSEYAVKQVLSGNAALIVDQLSTRQRGDLINRAFGPPRGR
jgi:predicted transcriptional regulator